MSPCALTGMDSGLSHGSPRFDDTLKVWIVTRYEHVAQIMRDPDTFEVRLATMPGADRETHSRVRRIIARAFATQQVKALADLTRVQARELANKIAVQQECELVGDYAVPIALTVVGAMLGVGRDVFGDLKRWSEAFLHTENPLLSPSERDVHRLRVGECYAFMSKHIAQLRDAPRDAFRAQYLTGEDTCDGLTLEEQVNVAMFLIIAGSETTSALIASCILKIVTNDDLQMRLRRERHLIPAFIEEVIRTDSPVQRTRRLTTCPADIGGVIIPQGAIVEPILAAANRDPEKYDEPDRFRTERSPNDHLGFGFGRHLCLGAQLARLEIGIALETLLDRFPYIVLARPEETISYGASFYVRSISRLDLRCVPPEQNAGSGSPRWRRAKDLLVQLLSGRQ